MHILDIEYKRITLVEEKFVNAFVAVLLQFISQAAEGSEKIQTAPLNSSALSVCGD